MSREFLGRTVKVIIDRPLGSLHPDHGYVYPVNYGYVPGTIAPDGEEVDAYVLGVEEPITVFEGRCIAIIERKNDIEDKLIVVPFECYLSEAQIRTMTDFQEFYFEINITIIQAL